jgi:hypothetical protein
MWGRERLLKDSARHLATCPLGFRPVACLGRRAEFLRTHVTSSVHPEERA